MSDEIPSKSKIFREYVKKMSNVNSETQKSQISKKIQNNQKRNLCSKVYNTVESMNLDKDMR